MDIIFWRILLYVSAGMHSNPTPAPVCKERSLDASRAFIILILILTVLQTRAEKQPQCGRPTPPQCKDDCDGKEWFPATDPVSGAVTCQLNATLQCIQLDCPPGFQPDRDCGGEDGIEASCVQICPPGEFFDTVGCVLCRVCDNTVGDVDCTATSDRKCGGCKKGYYHEQSTPDLCHPCWFLLQPQLEPQCQTSTGMTEPPYDVTTIENSSAPSSEVSSTEVPSTEAPSTQAPSTEAPSTEARSTEAPSTEAPSTEAPSTEAPSTEAPSTEAPSTEAPSSEVPSTEAPSTEVPSTEAPSTELAPLTEVPSTTEPPDHEPNFEDGSSEIKEDKETDEERELEGLSEASSRPVLIICLVILVLLFLFIVGFIGNVVKRRFRKNAERRQQQRTSYRRDLQANPTEDSSQNLENGEGRVGFNWLDGSVRYQTLATRAPHEKLVDTRLLMSPLDLQGDKTSSEDTHLLGFETMEQGESANNIPATLRSIDESASLLGNAERAKRADRKQGGLKMDGPHEVFANIPCEIEDSSADQESEAAGQSETTEDLEVPFEQEATICHHQEVQTEAAATNDGNVEEPRAVSTAVGEFTTAERKSKKDEEREKPVELEATTCKQQETQTEPAACTTPNASLSEDLGRGTSGPDPVTNQGPPMYKKAKTETPLINVVCNGNKNRINVHFQCHRNGSFNDSETESDMD